MEKEDEEMVIPEPEWELTLDTQPNRLKPPYQLLAIKQDQSHLNAIANMFSLRSQLEGKQGPYQLHNGSTIRMER